MDYGGCAAGYVLIYLPGIFRPTGESIIARRFLAPRRRSLTTDRLRIIVICPVHCPLELDLMVAVPFRTSAAAVSKLGYLLSLGRCGGI